MFFKPLWICDISSFSLFFIIQSHYLVVKYLGRGIFSFAQISYLVSALCHSDKAERVRETLSINQRCYLLGILEASLFGEIETAG